MGEVIGGQEKVWPVGWEGHERAQLLYYARLPLAAKLRWLEEAHRLVLHLQRQAPPAGGRHE